MDELGELKGRMRALRNVKKVRLVNLPKLSVMVLRFAFVDVKELDLTAFQNLQTLCIEERCFLFVEKVSILGLQHLKSIDIGKLCFIVKYDRVENSALSIKDCQSLDSIRIGGSSFRCFSLDMESE